MEKNIAQAISREDNKTQIYPVSHLGTERSGKIPLFFSTCQIGSEDSGNILLLRMTGVSEDTWEQHRSSGQWS